MILPQPKPNPAAHEFAPKQGWRIIATINSIDKAALYQMSFALTRRFGWIYIDAPRDLNAFLIEIMVRLGVARAEDKPEGPVPLALVWEAVNRVRVIGPAPVIDMIKTIHAMDSNVNLHVSPTGSQPAIYLDSFFMYVLPMLDGILRRQAAEITDAVGDVLGLSADSTEVRTLSQRLGELAV